MKYFEVFSIPTGETFGVYYAQSELDALDQYARELDYRNWIDLITLNNGSYANVRPLT